MFEKVGIGTAHWGENYGKFKKSESITNQEAINILNYAFNNHINLIDTASSYLNAEKKIGDLKEAKNFQIITKIKPLNKKINIKDQIDEIILNFKNSLANLNRKSIKGILVHNSEDLIHDDGEYLWEELNKLKEKKIIEKIGVSVYDLKNSDKIIKKYKIDIIQIPINVFDQRFLNSGMIEDLNKKDIEIHARSIFLQGILGIDPYTSNNLPQELNILLKNFVEYLKPFNLSAIEGAIIFTFNLKQLSKFIIGFNKVDEIKFIKNTVQNKLLKNLDFSSFKITNKNLIDPRFW